VNPIARLFVAIGIDPKEFEQGLKGVNQKLGAAGKTMMKTGAGLTAGLTAPILAAGKAISVLSNEAMAFEGKMNEVFTLMPGISGQAMGEMSGQVKDFAKEFGVLPDKVVPALYQSISAGVPPDNVFSFLEIAQKAAVGGVTELETAVDGISSVVNAYGSDVIDAAKASDLMFTAVKLGKTNFEELSRSLFQVIPTASALGVEFGDVTAALAALTAQGTPTSVATTQMRQLLVELSKEGGKASKTFQEIAKKSFKQFVAEGNNVQDALMLMEEHAKKAGVGVNDLFASVEAGNAALGLTGKGTETFAANLKEMDGAAGATEAAYAKMEEGVGRQMEKLKAAFAVLRLEVGEKFLPIINDTLVPIIQNSVMPALEKLADWIAKAAEWFQKLSPETQQFTLIAVALAAVLGPLVVLIGGVVSAIAAIGLPVIAAVAAIGLLIAAGVKLYQNWDKIKAFGTTVWNAIADAVRRNINGMIDGINLLIRAINKIPGVNIKEIGKLELSAEKAAREAAEQRAALWASDTGDDNLVAGGKNPYKVVSDDLVVGVKKAVVTKTEPVNAVPTTAEKLVANAIKTEGEETQSTLKKGFDSLGKTMSKVGEKISLSLSDRLKQDIARVTALKGNKDAEAYFAKNWGSIDEYLASQTLRLSQEGNPVVTDRILTAGATSGCKGDTHFHFYAPVYDRNDVRQQINAAAKVLRLQGVNP
jgi:TP901 family phage tail tape measure protein